MQPRKISPLNLVDTIGCNDENIYYYYGSSLTHTPYQMQASHNKCTFEGTMRKDSFYSNARGNQVANLDGKKCAVIFIGDRLGRLTRNGFNFHFSLEAKRLYRFTIKKKNIEGEINFRTEDGSMISKIFKETFNDRE
jgi:hypothetical protein